MAKRTSHTARPSRARTSQTVAQPAAGQIDAACAAVVEGRLAERELGAWARGGAVTETELRLLWMLCGDESPTVTRRPCDQSDYADRLAVSAAQVSAVVERLGQRRLIEAAVDPDDRRRKLWRLTAAGRAVIGDIVAAVVGKEAA